MKIYEKLEERVKYCIFPNVLFLRSIVLFVSKHSEKDILWSTKLQN